MKSIVLREIKSFFGSPIGYLVIGLFLLLNGLFLWVFAGEYNILDSGFADLNPFFTLAPMVLLFLIPAVTMRSFSDEMKQGTLELLLTKPLSLWQIVTGKFLGAFLLITIALIPTIIYVIVVVNLQAPTQTFDYGSTLGSYFGLLFLIASYCAIGLFTSTLSENQIIAFIVSVFICFVFYFGFEAISQIIPVFKDFLGAIGMNAHFKSMARGLLDSRDVIYFASISFFFLSLTVYKLKSFRL
jgi:ABC-2 type transport system permease protein